MLEWLTRAFPYHTQRHNKKRIRLHLRVLQSEFQAHEQSYDVAN